MAIEKYRAFYLPKNKQQDYTLVDSRDLNQLPAGAILVIQMNEDGTREVISEKNERTTSEQIVHTIGSKHLEFKHDG